MTTPSMRIGCPQTCRKRGNNMRKTKKIWLSLIIWQSLSVFSVQGKEYKKGPDVGSKSKRTQELYCKLMKDQTSLISFGFSQATTRHAKPSPPLESPSPSPTNDEMCTHHTNDEICTHRSSQQEMPVAVANPC